MSYLDVSIWEIAQSSYDRASSIRAVGLAVDSYRRALGFNARTLMHASSIGGAATQMLWGLLQKSALALSSLEESASFCKCQTGFENASAAPIADAATAGRLHTTNNADHIGNFRRSSLASNFLSCRVTGRVLLCSFSAFNAWLMM